MYADAVCTTGHVQTRQLRSTLRRYPASLYYRKSNRDRNTAGGEVDAVLWDDTVSFLHTYLRISPLTCPGAELLQHKGLAVHLLPLSPPMTLMGVQSTPSRPSRGPRMPSSPALEDDVLYNKGRRKACISDSLKLAFIIESLTD